MGFSVTIRAMQETPNPDRRLTALEEKLAYLEKHVGELDEVVRDLATRLEQQIRGIRQMRSTLEQHLAGGDAKADTAPDPEGDRPPHW